MNIIFHALLGLLFARLYVVTDILAVSIGLLFSILPDFDHIPHLKRAFKTGRFGVESRSPLHELVGLFLALSGSFAALIINSHLFLLTLSCGLSHFIVDFLTRTCRPLYPFSTRKVNLSFYPKELKRMFIWDTILTATLGIMNLVVAIMF